MKKIIPFLSMLLFSCSNEENSHAEIAQPIVKDCLPGNPGIVEISVAGDGYFVPIAGEPIFSGFADPGLRKDLLTNALYFTYSWPNYKYINGYRHASVDIHLATSSDGGNTFSFIKNLWPSSQMNNPANTTQPGVLNCETGNLIPVLENGQEVWYGTTFNYFVSNTGSGSTIANNSFHIRIFKANSPENLTISEPCLISTNSLDNGWGERKNFSALSPELANLDFWCEPSLYYADGKLYLILVSFDYDNNATPIMANNAVHVFSTIPNGNPVDWNWSYNGKLSGQDEANELGAERLTQIDIAKSQDGKLLMIATPDDWNAAEQDYNHKGCKVLEIASLANPQLKRNTNGSLKVRAIITASDANSLGSAASAYDPYSSTGILFTRRSKTATSFTIDIWRTGLHP